MELNADAVRDAVWNARRNRVNNIRFVKMDATDYIVRAVSSKNPDDTPRPDVLILDPPRSGTTARFIEAAARLSPERIVYVSCGPDTLARDLKAFRKNGYRAEEAQPADLFPYTQHIESVVKLTRAK